MTYKYKIVASIWKWWALQKIRPLSLKIRPPESPEHLEVGGCISLRFWAIKKPKPVLDFTTTADSYSKRKCEKTSKMTIFEQQNQNRRFWVRVETLQVKIWISVQILVKNEIKNCSRSKTHKSKNVEGGKIYAHKKNWTSKLTGSWVIPI